MKSNTLLKLTAVFIFGFISLVSCSSDDDNNIPDDFDTTSIFDKWWYDSNNFAADAYFYSDGRYEQKYIYLGNETTGTGDWVWEDENTGRMRIDNLDGQGQSWTTFWLKFDEIQSNNIIVHLSDDGDDFTFATINYQDSEN